MNNKKGLKGFISKCKSKANAIKLKALETLKNNDGGGELVAAIGLIIVAVIVLGAVFMPQISTFLTGVMSKITTEVDALWN